MTRKIILLVVLGLLAVNLTQARELKNNFYFTIQPDSEKCINVKLTPDIGVYEEDRIKINVTTDAETNIKFIDVLASPKNIVSIPLCFLSKGRKDGDFSDYTITINSDKTANEFVKGGFCISSNRTSVAIGRPETNPCDFTIRDEKMFDAYFVYGDKMPLKKDEPGILPVRLYSQNKIDIQLTARSRIDIKPKTEYIRLEPRKWETVEFQVGPAKSGSHEATIIAEAVVNGKLCDSKIMPFCKKEITSTIFVDTIGLQGWYAYVTPNSYSAYDTKRIPYTLTIENYEEEKEFTVDLNLPKGLSSAFAKSTLRIASGEKRELIIEIAPQVISPENFELEFIISSDSEKRLKSYLSFRDTEANVNAYWSEIRDKLNSEERVEIDLQVRDFVAKYREKGIDVEEYQSLLSLLEKAKGKIFTEDIKEVSTKEERPAIRKPADAYTIVAILVFVVIIISIFFYLRSRGNKEEAE